jgi:hypothetical protein
MLVGRGFRGRDSSGSADLKEVLGADSPVARRPEYGIFRVQCYRAAATAPQKEKGYYQALLSLSGLGKMRGGNWRST